MRPIVLGAAAIFLLAVAGCSRSEAQPGPEVSRTFAVGPFTALEVQGAYNVVVTTGKPVAVSARGTKRLVEAITADVRNGKLVIRPSERRWNERWGRGRSWATVNITVPSLTAVSLAGSGDTRVDRIQGSSFNGAVAGSGDLSLGTIAVRELKLTVAGSGGLKAAGRADSANYSVAGSGELDAGGLTARQASISTAGSGSIRANVTGEAVANVAGSGSIDVSGGAKCQQSRQGSGNIRCS
jgi:hypothetical protein